MTDTWRLDPEIDSWELDDTRHLANLKALAREGFHLPIQNNPGTYKERQRMKRVEDFNEFLSDHVNIKPIPFG